MKSVLNKQNISYGLAFGAASLSGYAAAFLTSYNMNLAGYNAGEISTATLAAKEVAFFSSNLFFHSIFRAKDYASMAEWKKDMRGLCVSNINSMGLGTAIKGGLHYLFMKKLGISPEYAMLSVYIPAGLAGTSLKLFLDVKKGVLRKTVKKTLEDITDSPKVE